MRAFTRAMSADSFMFEASSMSVSNARSLS